MGNYSYNKDYFNKIDSNEKAYWLGFLYADGCITRFYRGEKLKSMSLEVTLKSDDKSHLELFNKCLNSNVEIKTKIIKDKYSACKLVINCTKMCRDLIALGCTPAKSLILTYPTENILPKEFERDFIRGYFDGDGGIQNNNTEVFFKNRNKSYMQNHYSCYFCGNEKFILSIKEILENNNIKVSDVYKDSRSEARNIYIYGKENINVFKKYIYNNSNICLRRKLNKFL